MMDGVEISERGLQVCWFHFFTITHTKDKHPNKKKSYDVLAYFFHGLRPPGNDDFAYSCRLIPFRVEDCLDCNLLLNVFASLRVKAEDFFLHRIHIGKNTKNLLLRLCLRMYLFCRDLQSSCQQDFYTYQDLLIVLETNNH